MNTTDIKLAEFRREKIDCLATIWKQIRDESAINTRDAHGMYRAYEIVKEALNEDGNWITDKFENEDKERAYIHYLVNGPVFGIDNDLRGAFDAGYESRNKLHKEQMLDMQIELDLID